MTTKKDLETSTQNFLYGLKQLIHYLTDNGQWEMGVDISIKWWYRWYYLHYNQFSVGSASEEYPLTVGGFTGVGTDWFNQPSDPLNETKFSTPDNDNDISSGS